MMTKTKNENNLKLMNSIEFKINVIVFCLTKRNSKLFPYVIEMGICLGMIPAIRVQLFGEELILLDRFNSSKAIFFGKSEILKTKSQFAIRNIFIFSRPAQSFAIATKIMLKTFALSMTMHPIYYWYPWIFDSIHLCHILCSFVSLKNCTAGHSQPLVIIPNIYLYVCYVFI